MTRKIIIEKVITGGKGLGRLTDGMVVMLPGVLPGECVEFRETRRHGGYIEAEVVAITAAASERVAPACPYYGACGGCDLQHASYPLQLRLKEEIVREALSRARVEGGEYRPVLPAPSPFAYRHRLRLQVGANNRLGFHRARTNEVVALSSCAVATAPLNRVLAELAQLTWPVSLASYYSEIELLHSPADGRVLALLHAHAHDQAGCCAALLEVLAELPSLAGLFVKKGRHIQQVHPLAAPGREAALAQHFSAPDPAREFTLSWGVGCFSQVNAAQNEHLIELVRQVVTGGAGTRILDLYCGMGNFSIPLGRLGSSGLGIEQNQESISWARRNSARAGLRGWDFRGAEVAAALRELQRRGERFDWVVCDPPRQGLGPAVTRLAELAPAHLVYISCDPATLARDLAHLTGAGYQLATLTPVDMFPQTHHIESVAFLKRN